jgi:uncharacterized repeat protein (TIGR03803 family)
MTSVWSRREKIMKKTASAILFGFFLLALPVWPQINLLHEFTVESGNGIYPIGSLILSGTTLYGMTHEGGSNANGTIFKVQSDGTGYTLLHEFAGATDDGATPFGNLILSGSTLYGMTYYGGANDKGTIFKMQEDGTGYSILHDFTGSSTDGQCPHGSLVISGSTLYGMTTFGGVYGDGTIFKMETDGTNFILLHSFPTYVNDGEGPSGNLILSNTTLYGMTKSGHSNAGIIFKIETDGSGYSVLHEFDGDDYDGIWPNGSLILSGTTLYGMTGAGGTNNYGTIFKIETNGSAYMALHNFAGSTSDGSRPDGSLIIIENTLFGMTNVGGASDLGIIFNSKTDGTGFTLLHSFNGSTTDGANPCSDLILTGSTLYGMTEHGGDDNMGVVFSLPLYSISGTVTYDGSPLAGVLMDGLPGNPVTNGSGYYSAWVESGWSGTVTPTLQYHVFSPSETAYTDIPNDQTTDYTAAFPQPLIVAAPSGGSLWEKGRTYAITWFKQGEQDDRVKIGLYKGTNTLVKWLVKNTANDGVYDWLVPANLATGSKYFIKVKTMDNLIYDDSDKFSIIVPSITVTAPGPGAVWARNTTGTITWDSRGTQNANVKIQLYKGTAKKLDIILSTPNSGSYDWAIPSLPPGTDYSIRITTVDGKVKGKSKNFKITKD